MRFSYENILTWLKACTQIRFIGLVSSKDDQNGVACKKGHVGVVRCANELWEGVLLGPGRSVGIQKCFEGLH